MVRDELTPRRIEKLTGKQIHSVSCGGFHTIAVTENGSIYSWGLGGTFDIETHSMFCVSGMMLKGKKFVVCFSLLSEIIQEKHPHVGFVGSPFTFSCCGGRAWSAWDGRRLHCVSAAESAHSAKCGETPPVGRHLTGPQDP